MNDKWFRGNMWNWPQSRFRQLTSSKEVYLDERWKNIMDGINQALPNTINGFTSMDEAETVGIVASGTSQQPTRYFLAN
jgi:hypothetical protein